MALTQVSRGLLSTSIVDNGNATAITIDSSENVGIGTGSPDRPLHIAGNPAMLLLEDTGGGTNDKRAQLQVDSGAFEINSRNDDNSSRVDNIFVADLGTGNIGIGTSSPNALLDLEDTTPTLRLTDHRNITWSGGETLGNIEFFSSDASASGTHVTGFIKNINDRTGGSTQVAGALTFGVSDYDTAASEAMRIDSSGRVGIGTSSPGRLLTIAATTPLLSLVGSSSATAQILFGDSGSDTQGKLTYNNSNDSLAIHVNASERMRIDSSGNLLVGTTTSPSSNNAKAVRYGVGVQGGSLSSTVALTSGVVGDVIDMSSVTSGTTGAGMYLVTLVRDGGSYGTNFVGIYGVNQSQITLYETLYFTGIAISVSGTTIRANVGTSDSYNCNVIPLSIDN